MDSTSGLLNVAAGDYQSRQTSNDQLGGFQPPDGGNRRP